jgi:hypothetical protein
MLIRMTRIFAVLVVAMGVTCLSPTFKAQTSSAGQQELPHPSGCAA